MASKDREKEVAARLGVTVPSLRRALSNLVTTCDVCGSRVKWLELQADGCPTCKEIDGAAAPTSEGEG